MFLSFGCSDGEGPVRLSAKSSSRGPGRPHAWNGRDCCGRQAAQLRLRTPPPCRSTRFSNCIERWFHLPEPVKGAGEYGVALLSAAQQFGADLILPTCEEALYVSHQRRRLKQQCRVFVSDFDLMARLHDKAEFAELARELPISAPATVRIKSAEALMQQANCSRDLVFKPVYSQFAARALLRPAAEALQTVQPSPADPWIAQQFVAGQELCSYSLLENRQLLAHACYHPKYRVGQGSGIYLEPLVSDRIQEYIRAFGVKTLYSGQVGFDFMKSADGSLCALECNPRATSGIHLFHRQAAELTALLDPLQDRSAEEPPLQATGEPRMIGLAMILFAAPTLLTAAPMREFVRDWRRASDILASPRDPVPVLAQMLGLGEIYYRAIHSRRSPLSASTQDIEWNGQPLGAQP